MDKIEKNWQIGQNWIMNSEQNWKIVRIKKKDELDIPI